MPAPPTQSYATLFFAAEMKLKGNPETEEAWKGSLRLGDSYFAWLSDPATVSSLAVQLDLNGQLVRQAHVLRSQNRVGEGWFSIDIPAAVAAIKSTEMGSMPVGPVLYRNPIFQWAYTLEGSPVYGPLCRPGNGLLLGPATTFIPFSTDFAVLSRRHIKLDDGGQWSILGVAMASRNQTPVTGFIVDTKSTVGAR